MSLTIRKIIMLGLVGSMFLLGNIVLVANWLAEHGVVNWAGSIRAEYLTGTVVTIIVILLILLVSPKPGTLVRRYPVCDHVLLNWGKDCGECGSKV